MPPTRWQWQHESSMMSQWARWHKSLQDSTRAQGLAKAFFVVDLWRAKSGHRPQPMSSMLFGLLGLWLRLRRGRRERNNPLRSLKQSVYNKNSSMSESLILLQQRRSGIWFVGLQFAMRCSEQTCSFLIRRPKQFATMIEIKATTKYRPWGWNRNHKVGGLALYRLS